jgi:putative Ig domain-containing protein
VPRGFLLNQFTTSGPEAGALRDVLVVAEGSSMRRIRILVVAAIACLAALGVVSNASAGDFADDPCPLESGDNYLCPAGTAGSPYALDIKLKEPWPGCTRFAVSSGSFPPGLSISDDGNIRGTPTAAGSYTFYLTVSWASDGGCVSQPPSDRKFTINIKPGTAAPPTPTVTLAVSTASLPDANINQPYTSPALTASGATVNSWSLASGTLPAGLTLAPNGVISGQPTQSGTFPFVVQANASGASATKQLSLFVIAPLAIQTLVDKTPPEKGLTAKRLVNQPLATGVKAVGGRAPYAFTAEGTVPPGLTVDAATGKITGSGTSAGRYPFTVTVTDGTGAKASVEWNITILPLLDFRKGKGLPIGHVNQLYSARIPVSGKDSSTAEFAIAGKIPPGLELDETGRLTGTLLKTGVYRIKVYAFPASGAPISKVFSIRVRA